MEAQSAPQPRPPRRKKVPMEKLGHAGKSHAGACGSRRSRRCRKRTVQGGIPRGAAPASGNGGGDPERIFRGSWSGQCEIQQASYGPPAPRACASTYSHPLLPPPQAANKLDSLPELEPGAGAKTAAAPLPHPEAAGRGFDCSFRITLGRFFDLNISYCNPPAGKPKEPVPK